MGFSVVRKSQITDMVLLAIAFSMLDKEENDNDAETGMAFLEKTGPIWSRI